MPMDQQGRHRPNPQIARHYDRMSGAGRQAPSPGRAPGGDAEPMGGGGEKDSVGSVKVVDHGDGTMHTEHDDGSKVEHPDVTHMAAHLMAHHSPGDKHMAMSHDGMNMKDSRADENGEVSGPQDHPDVDAAADAMREHMDGESGDGNVPAHGDEDGYGEDIEYGV